MLALITILGLLNTTLIICAKKWGWIDSYEIHRKPWMPKADCYLCMAFWMAMVQCIVCVIARNLSPVAIIYVPFSSAAITNFLTNTAFLHDQYKGR